MYAIEQGEVIEGVKKIGKANGLEATEADCWILRLTPASVSSGGKLNPIMLKMFIVALVQSEELYSKVNFWNEDVLSRKPETKLL